MFEGVSLDEFVAWKESPCPELRAKFTTLRQRAKVLTVGQPSDKEITLTHWDMWFPFVLIRLLTLAFREASLLLGFVSTLARPTMLNFLLQVCLALILSLMTDQAHAQRLSSSRRGSPRRSILNSMNTSEIVSSVLLHITCVLHGRNAFQRSLFVSHVTLRVRSDSHLLFLPLPHPRPLPGAVKNLIRGRTSKLSRKLRTDTEWQTKVWKGIKEACRNAEILQLLEEGKNTGSEKLHSMYSLPLFCLETPLII